MDALDQRLREFFDTVPAMLWITGPDGATTFLSRGWYEYTGQGEAEALGFGWTAAVHADDRPGAAEQFMDANRRREPFSIDYRVRRADGEYRWAIDTGRPRFSPAGEFLGYIGSVIDVHDRASAEQALRASEERLRAIVEATPECVKIVAADGTLRQMNPSGLVMVGAACEADVVGRRIDEVIAPEDRERFRAFHQRICRGERGTLEFDIVGIDGRRRHMDTHAVPLREADGSFAQLALTRDVTERRRAEAALRESEQRYRAVVESQAEMVCRFRPEGEILFVNSAYARARGLAPEAMQGHSFWEFIPEQDRAPVRAMLDRLTPEAPEVRVENRFDTVAGERWTLWTNRALKFDAAGRVLEAQSTGIDITERKRAEEALAEEARTLETLNRVGKTLAAELDLEKTVQAVTDAATDLTGAQFGAFFYNVKNDAGESYMLYSLSGVPREAFAGFGMPRNTAVFGPTFAGQGMVRIDDVTKDARYGRNAPHQGMPKGHLPVRSYLAASVVSRTGEVIGGLFFGHAKPGVFTERAERLVSGIAAQAAVAIDNARLYEQSQKLVASLSEADRRKDEFLATLSHELRNPLAPLRNALHLLRISRKADGELAPIHEMMERQVNHLVRLTDDLLEMSRVTRGTFELRRERVELAAVVRNAIETSEPLIRAAGHELSVTLPRAPVWLDGDPVRLSQILANLLNNAARYTGNGGRIVVHAREEGRSALVSVRDNGAGIAAEQLARVFDMFSRGKDSSGLGIGLALARRLAQMHGGTLEAASEGPGRGAEFTLRLPLGAAARDAAPAPAEPAAPARMRILVVDDNRDAADSLAALLKVMGSEVRVAYDGPSALDAFRTWQPGVVLLDIGMPGMDGYTVARKLRADPAGRKVPIVAITGWGQEEDRRRAREAGFDHHLVKPPDLERLRSLLGTMH